MKYILGLGLDFLIVAQRLSRVDPAAKAFRPKLTKKRLFSHYTLIEARGARKANTLTLEFQGVQEGIRRVEERVVGLFHSMNRSGYPSAYVYNTGQWTKYQDLLVKCFQLSEQGRLDACRALVRYGVTELTLNPVLVTIERLPRLFESLVSDYPRSDPAENGGLVFQALAYGFVAADRPHLDILADKVRTGSSRQRRFGDIDCYNGIDLALSVEVKDLSIDENNIDRELGAFMELEREYEFRGLALVKKVSAGARKQLEARGIACMTVGELLATVATWDWAKQDRAVRGFLHYLAHIEQNPNAVNRARAFVATGGNPPAKQS
jgi:hypothetical protein